jgi:PAS domain S-box-containing protein
LSRSVELLDPHLLEESAEDLYENAPCGYVSTLPDGLVVKVNGTLLRWTGYAREDLVLRKRWQELLSVPGRIYHETHLAPLLAMQGAISEITLDLLRSDGHLLPVLVNTVQTRDAAGNPLLNRTTLSNATERRQYERELLLARRRAEAALAALAEADRHKDEFLAILGHELRNPLNALSLEVAILRRRVGDDPRLQRSTDVMERQISRMARLVTDLQDLSRIKRGEVALDRQPVDLRMIAAVACETAQASIQAREHSFTFRQPETALWVSGDATRLEQVVTNLLTNAARYTEPGGEITLALDREGVDAVLRVTDTGIGIPADVLPRIFDLFMRAERSVEHAREGMGLGLALVEGFVRLHGGSVAARSAGPDLGSEFEVRLPLLSAGPTGALGEPHGA